MIKSYSIENLSPHLFWDVDKTTLDFEKSKIELEALVEKLGIEAVSIAAKTSKMNIKVFVHEGKFHEIKASEEQGAWRISAIVFKR
jgi:50S ribosomal subunit-associated GTPase HflX